jgi:hypothetical protein
MTITFDESDEQLVIDRLNEYGISISNEWIKEVLYNVNAAFKQQLRDEVDYIIIMRRRSLKQTSE